MERTEGKRWLHHPRVETFLAERVALFQRVYRLSLIHISNDLLVGLGIVKIAQGGVFFHQAGQRAADLALVALLGHSDGHEQAGLGAVSYTHLDVYKRQGHTQRQSGTGKSDKQWNG